MSARALEFVETWVSEKIEEIELPKDGDDSQAKALAAQCVQAAQEEEGIPESEIQEAFDDLAAFIGGEIEEAKDRAEDDDDEDEDDDDDHDGKDDEKDK